MIPSHIFNFDVPFPFASIGNKLTKDSLENVAKENYIHCGL